MKFGLVLPAITALVLWAAPASADVIELADGRMLHGEIVSGQTTEDGLAVRVFQTGGVVLVKWDHVLESRRKDLRVAYGIDIAEEESVTVGGHIVTLTNGTQVTGVVENFEEWSAGGSSLELKTPTGSQPYPRERVARVDTVEIEALAAYTVDELYARRRDENPPETAAAHFALGDFCQRIGDFVHAKEHYEAAKADAEFTETVDGKSLDTRLRRVDILLRAAGAQDLAREIQRAMFRKDWNAALAKLIEMDEQVSDEQIRDAVGFERLRNRVERGRNDHFRKQVAVTVYRIADDLIEAKVREKKPLRADSGTAGQGTLAGARMWAVRELPNDLWKAVSERLGLEAEELDKFWSERSTRKVETATYGTGSFIVIQRATLPGGKNNRRNRRGAPGARPQRGGGGGPNVQAAQPKTDEEWWSAVRNNDKAKWLEAYFVENSGLFEIVRADESDLCGNCAGRGFSSTATSDGGESHSFCVQCNGAGKFRSVKYR